MNRHAASGGRSNLSPVSGDPLELPNAPERRLFPIRTDSGLLTARLKIISARLSGWDMGNLDAVSSVNP
jgi:hypothetical protein